jgi:hypothetical protein
MLRADSACKRAQERVQCCYARRASGHAQMAPGPAAAAAAAAPGQPRPAAGRAAPLAQPPAAARAAPAPPRSHATSTCPPARGCRLSPAPGSRAQTLKAWNLCSSGGCCTRAPLFHALMISSRCAATGCPACQLHGNSGQRITLLTIMAWYCVGQHLEQGIHIRPDSLA